MQQNISKSYEKVMRLKNKISFMKKITKQQSYIFKLSSFNIKLVYIIQLTPISNTTNIFVRAF